MSDHNTGNLRVGQQFVAAFGKLEQHIIGHVVGADLNDLFAGDIGEILNSGNSVNQRLDSQIAGFVTGHLGARRGGAGNCAARGKNSHIGQIGCKSAASHGQGQSGRKQSFFHVKTPQFLLRREKNCSRPADIV